MALVPFRVSGQAASQQLDSQLLQVGPFSLLLHQRPKDSGNTAHLTQAGQEQREGMLQEQSGSKDHLTNVGLVLWQSGFVLADFLLLRLPQLQHSASSGPGIWSGVRVLELGCGCGTVGMFLALAGAQVVVTDQAHILPLTTENLHLNFPATAAGSRRQPDRDQGTFGQRAQAVAHASPPASVSTPAQPTSSIADTASDLHSMKPPAAAACPEPSEVHPVGSVAEALAAAFCPATDDIVSAQQQEQQQKALVQQLTWDVFVRGPLVVQYNWGETLQQLQHRTTEAATARLAAAVEGSIQSARLLSQVVGSAYDVVVGADLLYDPECHQLLLESLNVVCAAHTQVFLCYRRRGLGERQFAQMASAVGWLAQEVDSCLLHSEFQGGAYRLICLSRLG